eukprot:4884410-Pleurochrysis_carterae.AAC.1
MRPWTCHQDCKIRRMIWHRFPHIQSSFPHTALSDEETVGAVPVAAAAAQAERQSACRHLPPKSPKSLAKAAAQCFPLFRASYYRPRVPCARPCYLPA